MGFKRLRVLKCISKEEQEAIRKFHENLSLDDPNHENWLLYRGAEIVGYADIHILSKPEATLVFFSAPTTESSYYFRNVVNEWIDIHGYNLQIDATRARLTN
jgi:hypothetical protein